MPITDLLEKNSKLYGNDVALVELNPEIKEIRRVTWKEFDLMELFLRNPNRVFSRTSLLDQVWGYEYQGDDRTVDVHIRRLREKLEEVPASPAYIMTKWGVGYYLKNEDAAR